jgi:hypothetical protein
MLKYLNQRVINQLHVFQYKGKSKMSIINKIKSFFKKE